MSNTYITSITYSEFEQKWDQYSDIFFKIDKDYCDQEVIQALKDQIKLSKKYPRYYKKLMKEIHRKN